MDTEFPNSVEDGTQSKYADAHLVLVPYPFVHSYFSITSGSAVRLNMNSEE